MKKKKNSTIISGRVPLTQFTEKKINELSIKGIINSDSIENVLDSISFTISVCRVPRILKELRDQKLEIFVNGGKVDISLLK